MMRAPWYAVALLLVGRASLPAQDSFISLTMYEVAAPLGDTRRFLSGPSWLGLSWEGRWSVSRRAAAGVSVGFNDFSERFSGTTNFPSGAATGPQFRYLLSLPLLATGYAYPLGGERVRWFAGGGAGVAHIDQVFQLGTRQVGRRGWHLAVAPEVGAEMYDFNGDLVGVVSLRFNAPFATGDYVGGGARSFQYLTLRVGMGERW
jgi:hypothetical protein